MSLNYELESPLKTEPKVDLDSSVTFNSAKLSLYELTDENFYDGFDPQQSIFLEKAPHHAELVTRFDIKYLNIIVYILLKNYTGLLTSTKMNSSQDFNSTLFMVILKNKLRILAKEQKIVDELFGISPQQSQSSSSAALNNLIPCIIKELTRKMNDMKSILQTEEDFKLASKVFRHFIMLVAILRLWELHNTRFFGNRQFSSDPGAFMMEYDKIAHYFTSTNEGTMQIQQLNSSMKNVLQYKEIHSEQISFAYPVNNQICELIFATLVDPDNDNQVS